MAGGVSDNSDSIVGESLRCLKLVEPDGDLAIIQYVWWIHTEDMTPLVNTP